MVQSKRKLISKIGKQYIEIMMVSIQNKTDNANLGVLINLLNIYERETLEEFSAEDIMSMIKENSCPVSLC